jgi:hypothetical protein
MPMKRDIHPARPVLAVGAGTLALAALTLLLTADDAQAYLDPGTGSLVLQIVAGSVLAVAYTVKVYWRRITSFFRRDTE